MISSSWPVGNGPLGYGDPVTTTIHGGAINLITAYFAKDLAVNLSALTDDMELSNGRCGDLMYKNLIRDLTVAGRSYRNYGNNGIKIPNKEKADLNIRSLGTFGTSGWWYKLHLGSSAGSYTGQPESKTVCFNAQDLKPTG
ncbi:hypothetical protein FQA39_LY19292 [Lamprigera yunnana]|nr:hypothetical protein FQA39_LY19292 [Lamprigera yunnana]